ncbi:MAG: hypothetical protein ACP5RI_00970 [Candidatus Micrarchaeia archaeon]
MRSADIITLFRTILVFFIIYFVLIKLNSILVILILLFMFALDGIDGFAAVKEVGKLNNKKITFKKYIKAAFGNSKYKKEVVELKHKAAEISKHGQRLDIAGDRIIEYSLWILFTYLNILPLFVILIIVIRNSFADAFMACKGTSAKLKSRYAKYLYSSNISRALSTLFKILSFSYLVLVYINNYPILPGFIIVAISLIFIIIRGAAEIYEGIID